MSMNGPYKKVYTFAEIQDYLEGKLSASDMHALEVAALDDPFLADAIEGFEKNKNEIAGKDINTIRERINSLKQKQEKEKSIFIRSNLWKVAAVLIISAGMLAITYNFRDNLKNKNIVASIKIKPADSSVPAKAPINTLMDSAPIVQNEVLKPGKSKAISGQKQEIIQPEVAPSASAAAKNEEHIENNNAYSKQEKAPEQKDYEENADSLNGKVAGIKTETKIKKPDEVAVTGYGISKSKKARSFSGQTLPEGGMEKFEEYILNNKKTDTLSNGHGQLIVTFYVNKNNRLSNFEIEKSLSGSRDKEAIDLIKAGPKWINSSRKKQKVRLPVNF